MRQLIRLRTGHDRLLWNHTDPVVSCWTGKSINPYTQKEPAPPSYRETRKRLGYE